MYSGIMIDEKSNQAAQHKNKINKNADVMMYIRLVKTT